MWALLNVSIISDFSNVHVWGVYVYNFVALAVNATTSDVEFCMKCKLHHSNPGNELVFCDSCMTCEFGFKYMQPHSLVLCMYSRHRPV